MNKIWFRYGIKIQWYDELKEVYIPKEKIDNSTYCQRCFRIIHYGINKDTKEPKSTDNIISNINSNAHFVIFLTDLININEELIKIYHKINKPKLMVISKSDLIPQSIRFDKIINNLKDIYNIKEDIKIISSNSGYGVNNLINYLLDNNIKEVYLLGETNAGKSSLINKMMDMIGSNLNKITTSDTSNTTLDFLRIKLSDDLTIIDSPGFYIEKRDSDNSLINPLIYQMKKGESLKIDNYYLNFSENANIVLYLNKKVNVSKYFKEIELENKLNIINESDLIIKGLGFINFKENCIIKTNIDRNLEIRRSIIKRYE